MISKIFKSAVIACLAFGLGNTVYAAQAVDLDDLLQQVKQGRIKDAAENQKRTEQIQTLTDEKADLEQKITEIQSDISQNQNLVATNQQLEEQIQACIESKADLEKENAELQSLKSNNQVLTVENQKLQEAIGSQANEINVLKTRLTEIRSMTQVQQAAEVQSTDAKPEAAQ
mgnify:CR=1 FL=1